MDEHTRTLLIGVMIAAGLTEIVVSDEDWTQAHDWVLDNPKATGRGASIRFAISEKPLSLDRRLAQTAQLGVTSPEDHRDA